MIEWSRISYNSGNYGDAKKKTAALYELRTQGISFGFCDNKLEKDDFCEISFKTKVASGLSYLYQFLIKTPWFQNVSIGNIRYEILINGQVMYSLMTTDYFSINQISICFQADKEEEKEVKIRLIALKDIDSPSYCGMLDILSLDIKRDFSRNYTSVPVVIDTFGMIKSHCLIKQ